MGTEETFIETLIKNGCSPFFFTSALQSVIFGELGRKNQKEIVKSNIEFKEHLRDIQQQYRKEQLEEQLLFRRESYEIGRQFLIHQTLVHNESRKKQIEFQDFLNNYWPLERTPYSVLEERREYLERKSVIPITVLVAKTEVTNSVMDSTKYGNFCEEIINQLIDLPNVTIEKTPWSKPSQSRISEAMNINYIMGGIPTLILFPYQIGNRISIETATWSFRRGLHSMHHDKFMIVENVENEKIIETTISAAITIIGIVRDAYMLAEYHSPVVFPGLINSSICSIPQLKETMISHYEDMRNLSYSKEFKQLCSKEELQKIEVSFNDKLLSN